MVAARLTADCHEAHFWPRTDASSAENEKKTRKQQNTFSSENETG